MRAEAMRAKYGEKLEYRSIRWLGNPDFRKVPLVVQPLENYEKGSNLAFVTMYDIRKGEYAWNGKYLRIYNYDEVVFFRQRKQVSELERLIKKKIKSVKKRPVAHAEVVSAEFCVRRLKL